MSHTPHEAPPRDAGGDNGPLVVFPGGRARKVPTDNLPVELTSFVGREREMTEVEGLLGDARLLTLTGPGGSGKTRLALEVARDLAGEFEDGVWLVEFASLSDPDLVPWAVASALDVREQPGRPLTETLTGHLGYKDTLLVLDNCEHLVEACAALVGVLLRAAPNPRVLATSREALGVDGEVKWRVSPLTMPDGSGGNEDITRYEAVRLFVERARLASPAFALTPENGSAVADICRKLEGIPLCVELAAAKVGALSVAQISARLDSCLRLLSGNIRTAPSRHRTLQAALDWSHDLLGDAERTLFRRLSVFAGGFSLEAAEAVGVEREEAMNTLLALIEKSLVKVEEGDAPRYRLLEPVRQYAVERLEESGEAEEVRKRHASYYLALAEEAEPELAGAEQVVWLERLEAEHGNVRAALSWALGRSGSPKLGAGISGALWRFWHERGHLGEGRSWLEAALRDGGALPATARAKLLTGSGMLAWEQGDYASASALHEESLIVARRLGNRPAIAHSLNNLGLVALYQDDYERTAELHEESLALRRELGDKGGSAASLHNLGLMALYEGDHARARTRMEESLSIVRELEDKWAISILLNNLGLVALYAGEHERARELQKESLALRRELRDRGGIAECLEGLSGVAASEGEASRAARLWAAAETLREAIGAPSPPGHRSLHDTHLNATRARLDSAAWDAAWAEGRKMPLETAIEYALEEQEPEERNLFAGLTRREIEVLRLVAKGLTNAEAAEKLYVSPRAINWHLTSIYRKVGAGSRAAAIRFAVENGLV
ncbi:MAG: tetratricopeptide repeat protein [Rubrobacteraceae bacterium]